MPPRKPHSGAATAPGFAIATRAQKDDTGSWERRWNRDWHWDNNWCPKDIQSTKQWKRNTIEVDADKDQDTTNGVSSSNEGDAKKQQEPGQELQHSDAWECRHWHRDWWHWDATWWPKRIQRGDRWDYEKIEEDAETEVDVNKTAPGKWVWPRAAARLWAHIFIHKRHAEFDIVPMLIGRGGKNTKDIFIATAAKVRIRGRGSGHLEVDGTKEAPVPLMIAITANKGDATGFKRAVVLAIKLLTEKAEHYKLFCSQRGLPPPSAKEPMFSFGEISHGSEELLHEFLMLYSHPGGPKPVKTVTPGGLAPAVEYGDECDDVRYQDEDGDLLDAAMNMAPLSHGSPKLSRTRGNIASPHARVPLLAKAHMCNTAPWRGYDFFMADFMHQCRQYAGSDQFTGYIQYHDQHDHPHGDCQYQGRVQCGGQYQGHGLYHEQLHGDYQCHAAGWYQGQLHGDGLGSLIGPHGNYNAPLDIWGLNGPTIWGPATVKHLSETMQKAW